MSEVKLFSDTTQRRDLEDLANLFAIINTCEALEAAYTRDAVTPSEYENECKRLISHFKETEAALIARGIIRDVTSFLEEYHVDSPRAVNRLLVVGVPATVVHASHDNRSDVAIVAETTQAYITALDALKLEHTAVDELQPLISDVMQSLTRVPGLRVVDFEGAMKVQTWLLKLNQLRAVDVLSEDDIRQMIFDVEASYTAFHAFLKSHN
jgi:ESCRT-I complex subunit VPS28